MGSAYTSHITAAEWRWVILLSSVLVLLAFIPFLWVLLTGILGTQWQFMGALHGFPEGAAQLAQVYQGSEGRWLTRFLLTPEPNDGTIFDLFYAFLGNISRLTSLSPIVIFHVARVGAALFMFLALYQLAAAVWMRVRTRRIFFVLAGMSSGFGWILAPVLENSTFLDITAPYVFPYHAILVNAHFPLAIGCMALVAGVVMRVFTADDVHAPTVNNGGVLIFLLGLMLSVVYLPAFLTLAVAFILQVVIQILQRADWYPRARWLLWFIVPVLPLLAYYGAVLHYNAVANTLWMHQNQPPPSLPVFVLSFGLPLILAIPGIMRTVVYREADEDQFMFIWLVLLVALVYMPLPIRDYFAVGAMIPVAYFATRSIEDFWFRYISRPWRLRLLAGLLPVLAASNLLVLFMPMQVVSGDNSRTMSGMLLQRDYLEVYALMQDQVGPQDVVLASPNASLWLPAWTGARVVYGHPVLTIDSRGKIGAVRNWYRADDPADCEALLEGDYSANGHYRVRFVIWGPQERELGDTVCLDQLNHVEQVGAVSLYINSN